MLVATVVGNIGNDVKLQVTKDNIKYARVSIAVNFDKENMQWIDATAYGNIAEFLSKYSLKGDSISCIGDLRLTEYADKEGYMVPCLKMNIQKCDLISKKERNRSDDNTGTSGNRRRNVN